jgi:succinate dehydrogenase / fumarate reductase membrane anchor subunit
MAYLTARKRAEGMGSTKSGTEHHWAMTVSSVGLLFLIPIFVITFGRMLGQPHAEVVAYFARPFPAIIAALTIFVSFMHFKNGVQALIEDYTGGATRKWLIIFMTCISYGAAAVGVFSIAKMAL